MYTPTHLSGYLPLSGSLESTFSSLRAVTLFCVFYQPFAHLFLPLIAFLVAVLLAHPFTLHKSEFFPLLFIFLILINIAYLFTQYFNLLSTWAI